jgi:lipopolysaccharide transport system permease protein
MRRWYWYVHPLTMFRGLSVHRHLATRLVQREIEGRYRGSYLGMLWSLVTPLFMLAIYTFVFSVVFHSRWPSGPADRAGFALTLFAGLIPFNVFTECINRAPSLIVGNPNYVKRVVFPLEVLPLSVLGSALFHAAVSLGVLVAGLLLFGRGVSATVLLLPVAAVPLVALSLAVSWFLASLGVYLRDTSYVVTIATQALFFVTPLFYPQEAVPAGFRPVLWLNPLTAVVDAFRRTMVFGQLPDWWTWGCVTAGSLVSMLLGYSWFMKTKSGFANVI